MQDVKDTGAKPFKAIDPYNPQNEVEGFVINTQNVPYEMMAASVPKDVYGDLLITEVNGKSVKQYINATPKFHYPGHRESPRAIFSEKDFPDTGFRVYEKLDGTNILAFKYKDADGKVFISYKTRLTPFLRAEGFKDWITMFKQAFDKRNGLVDGFNKLPGNHAFEMFGYLNEILIKYEVEIALRYLYTVHEKGMLSYDGNEPAEYTGNGRKDALESYNRFCVEAERLFKDGKRAEGYVFYFDDGTVYKCKPVCVVEEQSASPFIGVDDIYVTAMNAAESIDTIDELEATTRALLSETYEAQKVERSEERIVVAVSKAKEYLLVQKSAMDVMKELGFTWSDASKAQIMRAVMSRFPKAMSTKIYGMLSGKKHGKAR